MAKPVCLLETAFRIGFSAIDTLVTNASLRRAIAQQARQEVLSDYTLASPRVQLYAEAYHAILGRPLHRGFAAALSRLG